MNIIYTLMNSCVLQAHSLPMLFASKAMLQHPMLCIQGYTEY